MIMSEMEEAISAIASMIERSEKAQSKFAQGTAQYSLQVNRIGALKIASTLVAKALSGDESQYTLEELNKAHAPIVSLISKSQKALQKLTEGTWQYKMLSENIKALYIALTLLEQEKTERAGK